MLFSPLADLDIGYLYDHYHVAFDFVLYLLVLIIACRVALARMFPGEQGKHLGTVIGVVLAISLSAAEKTLGFSMRSFGPIAAGLIIFMVALVMYNMMRHAGAGHAACSATALIVTYFSMRAVLPGFFLWAEYNKWASYLHTLLIVSILVGIWRIVQTLFRPPEVSAIRQASETVSSKSRKFFDFSRKQDKTEWRAVQHRMRKLTVKGKRECKKIINLLEQARDVILEHGVDPQAAVFICKALTDLKAREHVLVSELERIREVDVRLSRFDVSQFQRLKEAYGRLNKEQQAECKQMFTEERQKLGAEQAIENFAARAETYAVEFERCIDSACSCLQAGRPTDAAEWVGRAIEQEKEAEKLIQDMRKHEKILLSVLGRQIAELEAVSRE